MSGSMVWTEEEAQYLRALLAWRPSKAETESYPTAEKTKAPVGELRFLVIGAERCGKTSILTRFAEGTPQGEDQHPNPEHGRGCRRVVEIEDQAYVVDALELRPEHLADDPYLRQAIAITEAAILVYDVTARKSFERMAAVAEVIRDAVDTREYGLILVGNKSDCEGKEEEEQQRQVSWAEGHRLAASFRVRCSFVETSARKGDNVDRIFPQLGKDVLKLRWLMQQRRRIQDEEQLVLEDTDDVGLPVMKRRPRWRSWTRPWFQRRLDEEKASMT
ncbi:hypothetical protein SLS62_008345 [Diatrype stigma]|uniref:small monomeric GTPase n=1 Tax=Diatrype stigma TaxID=117547 RepID=A0AAN9YP16_9PEZI